MVHRSQQVTGTMMASKTGTVLSKSLVGGGLRGTPVPDP